MKHTLILIYLWVLTFPAEACSHELGHVPYMPPILPKHIVVFMKAAGMAGQTKVTADFSPNSQEIPYTIVVSMRSRIERILRISIEPESFTRDKMVRLAHQLNKDFPDEPRIYAVFFDSEIAARNYDPVGGSYPIAKRLERGQYYLDRLRGRESVNFSSQRGNSVDEIKITPGKKFTTGKKRRRSPR